MKRLARIVVVVGLTAAFAMPVRQAALATPFSDVPANHWAYQYLQSLAADGVIEGYADGKFKGDRPLSRYEMAVVVARVIAKLQQNQMPKGPSREDLDKLQKLIDALKDELDGLGVRVTNLEDSLDALDKRTKFAQALSLHGVFLPNVTFRQRPGTQRTVTNTTGVPVTTYYGAVVPSGAAGGTAVGSVDPFVDAFVATDDTNNPFTQATSGIQIRQDSRFSLAYQVNDNVTVSLPVHVLNFAWGGEFSQQSKLDLEPGVDISIAKTGAISNLEFTYGIIDSMTSSRTGLTFRAPQGYNGAIPYEQPAQPYQKGVALKGTVAEGTFGLTDFEASFTRVDNVLIDTQPGVTDPSVAAFNENNYFFPITPPQAGFTQTGAAGALRTDTFNSGSGAFTQVFLTQKAVAGSVYVSSYNGAAYNAAGAQTSGPPTPLPSFTYNDAYNSVVFNTLLGTGAVVGITYRGLAVTNNTSFQRYMTHVRLNQKLKGYDGLEVGVTFNRIFDFDDLRTTGNGADALTLVNAAAPSGYGLVSDTVLGIDFQAPLPFEVAGTGSRPVVYGEAAGSRFTADYRNVATRDDGAALIGLRVKVKHVDLSAQYQSVGVNFLDGAPFRYFGNSPALFAGYNQAYLPDFFGFGNNVAVNGQFDGQFAGTGVANPKTSGNPNLSFLFPVFNTLRAQGPTFYSAFAPNSRGFSASVGSPVRVGTYSFTARGGYQHLEEVAPSGLGAAPFGPAYATNRRLTNDAYTLGSTMRLPVFGQNPTVNVSATYETLKRLDATAHQYYPIDPATQVFAATALAAAGFAGGGTYGPGGRVSYYPNYVDVRHIVLSANASVPLTKDLVANASYSTQRYGGSAGTTLTQNISERKDYYTGALTYSIPKSNSSLTFLARHYGYTDDVVPNYNFSQDRQDLNFTVRF